MKCTCRYCHDIDYDNSIFFINSSQLFRQRPIGVTGLLRVKNDAEFLALCIESCIDALDELIIVYQDCEDNSPEIIAQKQQKYPNKIRSFFYQPKVLSHNLSDEEFAYAVKLPLNSIHLLCNYYNYALLKATFRYAVKIDADQIYFTQKFKTFCDAYRKQQKVKIKCKEYIACLHLYLYATLSQIGLKQVKKITRYISPSNQQVRRYQSYTLKKITNKKYTTSFSGINLLYTQGQWQLPLCNYDTGLFPPFNGCHDHLIFRIATDTYYKPQPVHSTNNYKYQNAIIETFTKNQSLTFYKSIFKPNLLYGGFLWYHVAPLKHSLQDRYPEYKGHLYTLFKNRIPYSTLENRLQSPLKRWMRGWYDIFWNIEQDLLPKQYLPDILNIIKRHTRYETTNETHRNSMG